MPCDHISKGSMVLLLLASFPHALASPFEPGPFTIAKWEYGTHHKPLPEIALHAHVWAPVNATGETLPVLAFVTAFGATIPATSYDQLFTRVASNGIVVIGYDLAALAVPQYLALARKLNVATQWMATNLADEFKQRGLSSRPDVSQKLAVGGHSAGNHVAVQALVDSCGLSKALVMIDPVDGVDPYGFIKTYVIPAPPKQLNVTTPALHIETGLDPVSARFGFPPCAPPYMSNGRFFDAMRAPIWRINATQYGHIDCMDNNTAASGLSGLICAEPPKSLDRMPYRSAVAGWIIAFMQGLFQAGQGSMLELLQTEASSPVDVLMDSKNMPASIGDVKPFCSNIE